MMVNNALRNIFIDAGVEKQLNAKEIIMHDWWLVLIAASYGEIVYVDKTLVLYRQHSNNTLGAGDKTDVSLFKKIMSNKLFKIISNIKHNLIESNEQAKLFYKLYKSGLDYEMKNFIYDYQNHRNMNIFQRISFLRKYKLSRTGRKSTLIFDLIFIFGNF